MSKATRERMISNVTIVLLLTTNTKDFHDWSAKRTTHQTTAAKEKEPGLRAMPVPRRLILLSENVEEDKGEMYIYIYIYIYNLF